MESRSFASFEMRIIQVQSALHHYPSPGQESFALRLIGLGPAYDYNHWLRLPTYRRDVQS